MRSCHFLSALLLVSPATAASGATWTSEKVQVAPDGTLSYPADAEGNRIPDFSNAGYRGGGIALPDVPTVKTIAPVAGDNTAHIQAALDEVGAMPLDANGHRGALLLSAGLYEVSGTLRMQHDGVVLRGVGQGDDPATNTVIRRTGTSTAQVILAGGASNDNFRSEVAGTRTMITTDLVPVGARSFAVESAGAFVVGDTVVIEHPSTNAWLDAVRRGDTEGEALWQAGEIDIRYHRYITRIDGQTITIDAPVFNHLDRSLSQSHLFKYNRAGIITELGLDNLFVDIVTNGETSQDHATDAIQFQRCENVWARHVTVRHFVRAGILFGGSCTRATAFECSALEPHSVVTGGNRYNFLAERAQLILFENCRASYARHAFITNGTSLDSGIVVLDCINENSLASSEGHRRWPQGLLFDGFVTLQPQTSIILGLYNRGDYGTGHGWAAAHSVAWRSSVANRRLVVQQPPTAQNYAIGCFGTITGSGPFNQPAGFIEGTGLDGLTPHSLYRAQLAQRLAHSGPPRIVTAPAAQNVQAGMVTQFQVGVEGAGPFTYQWLRDGAELSGATAATLVLSDVAPAQSGNYSVRITGAEGTLTSDAVALVLAPRGDAQLVNLSARGQTSRDGDPLIAGFVVADATLSVLTRAIGPTLAGDPFNVSGTVADPNLTLFDAASQPLLVNDDWPAALAPTMAQCGAFALPDDSPDAALAEALPPALFSVIMRGDAGPGVALAEIYDASSSASEGRLINLSARATVGTGDAVLITGFFIAGNSDLQVLVRAVGPTLSEEPFLLPEPLADPRLELYPIGAGAPIATNDDWGDTAPDAIRAAAEQTFAFALPADSRDAALLITLPAGGYTVVVRGNDGGTGTALAEIYDVAR